MEQLIESGSEEMAAVFAGLFNLAIGSSARGSWAPVTMSARPSATDVDTPAGTVTLEVPKTAGHASPSTRVPWNAAGAPVMLAPRCT